MIVLRELRYFWFREARLTGFIHADHRQLWVQICIEECVLVDAGVHEYIHQ